MIRISMKHILLFLALVFIGLLNTLLHNSNLKFEFNRDKKTPEVINVALSVCGDNVTLCNLSTNMLKTAFLFTEKPVRFIIFANELSQEFISKKIESWPLEIRNKHIIEFREAIYPQKYKNWTNLFGPCATLRLFFPDMMPDVDSIIYLDTDILVVSDLHNLWKEFDRFTSKQMLGMAQEREDWDGKVYSYYNNATRIKFPFIPPYGINSGVILMNLTRMRDFSFFEKIHLIFKEFHSKIKLYDQDLLNILGYFNPDIVYRLNCSFNFHSHHCVPDLNCHSIRSEGPNLIHGFGGRFIGPTKHKYNEPFFEQIYKTIDRYNFTNSWNQLVSELKVEVKHLPQDQCTRYSDLILKPLLNADIK